MTGLAPPSEHLPQTRLPAASHIGHPCTGLKDLRHDPGLLLGGPTPQSRAGQNLNAPEATLRVVVNVEHNAGSKPSASSQISIVSPDDAPWP